MLSFTFLSLCYGFSMQTPNKILTYSYSSSGIHAYNKSYDLTIQHLVHSFPYKLFCFGLSNHFLKACRNYGNYLIIYPYWQQLDPMVCQGFTRPGVIFSPIGPGSVLGNHGSLQTLATNLTLWLACMAWGQDFWGSDHTAALLFSGRKCWREQNRIEVYLIRKLYYKTNVIDASHEKTKKCFSAPRASAQENQFPVNKIIFIHSIS